MAIGDQDEQYYHMRFRQERERALAADSPEASAAHRALADMYRRRLEKATASHPGDRPL